MTRPAVAIVHDYLTQRGGAERVVLAFARAFPEAPIHTSLYHPGGTFPEFADLDVRVGPLDRVPLLRSRHRLALPLLAPTFGHTTIDADVVLCSSSGWAHGVRTSGRKIVYCHSPARWLHAREQYLPRRSAAVGRLAVAVLGPALARWDRAAAAGADRYLANSTLIRDRIRGAYGIDAQIVAPPFVMTTEGEQEPLAGLEPGFVLCVARLLPYKHVAETVQAFARPELRGARLVVVGSGPEARAVRSVAGPAVRVLGSVSDARLRWLYANAAGLVAASHEDFGLAPLEAAAFGKPVAALRYGGFLDTVVEGRTGVFFDAPDPASIAAGVRTMGSQAWDSDAIRGHAAQFAVDVFVDRIRAIVAEEGEDRRGAGPGGRIDHV